MFSDYSPRARARWDFPQVDILSVCGATLYAHARDGTLASHHSGYLPLLLLSTRTRRIVLLVLSLCTIVNQLDAEAEQFQRQQIEQVK